MVVGDLYGGHGSAATKGAGSGGGGGADSGANNNIDGAQILDVNAKSPPSSPQNDAKNGDQAGRKIKRDGSSSSSSSNDVSVRSHESEMPLALSMQS